MKTKATHPAPTYLSPAAIGKHVTQSMADFANATPDPARRKYIAQRFSELAGGKPLLRQQLDRWLHVDPERREIPTLGACILLKTVIDRAIAEANGHKVEWRDIGNDVAIFRIPDKPARRRNIGRELGGNGRRGMIGRR